MLLLLRPSKAILDITPPPDSGAAGGGGGEPRPNREGIPHERILIPRLGAKKSQRLTKSAKQILGVPSKAISESPQIALPLLEWIISLIQIDITLIEQAFPKRLIIFDPLTDEEILLYFMMTEE